VQRLSENEEGTKAPTHGGSHSRRKKKGDSFSATYWKQVARSLLKKKNSLESFSGKEMRGRGGFADTSNERDLLVNNLGVQEEALEGSSEGGKTKGNQTHTKGKRAGRACFVNRKSE